MQGVLLIDQNGLCVAGITVPHHHTNYSKLAAGTADASRSGYLLNALHASKASSAQIDLNGSSVSLYKEKDMTVALWV